MAVRAGWEFESTISSKVGSDHILLAGGSGGSTPRHHSQSCEIRSKLLPKYIDKGVAYLLATADFFRTRGGGGSKLSSLSAILSNT